MFVLESSARLWVLTDAENSQTDGQLHTPENTNEDQGVQGLEKGRGGDRAWEWTLKTWASGSP
jgi:hypothetical protein